MTIWATASAAIDAVFADPEAIVYTGGGLVAAPVKAIRLDLDAPEFDGVGSTLPRIVYEVAFAAFPGEPKKPDFFTHRGRRWNIQQAQRRDDVGKWRLDVTQGPAAP